METRKIIEMGIQSHRQRMHESERKAIDFINDGLYTVAAMKLVEAAGFQAAARELEFQLEAMEV